MSALLPIVRPFDQTYEAWTQRDATHDEILASLPGGPICLTVNDRLIASVTNEYEAAEYMARHACDNGLEFHIDRALAEDPGFRQWLEAMPRTVPAALQQYQLEYPLEDLSDVATAIDAHGAFLSPGQILFAYFGDRDRPFRRIVTAAQRAVLRPEILVHAVTMMRFFSTLSATFASLLRNAPVPKCC